MNQFRLRWSSAKSAELKLERGLSFEEFLQGEVIATRTHPTRPNQFMLLILLNDYVWVAPFVPDDDGIFLKALYRSRKYTKAFRRGDLS